MARISTANIITEQEPPVAYVGACEDIQVMWEDATTLEPVSQTATKPTTSYSIGRLVPTALPYRLPAPLTT